MTTIIIENDTIEINTRTGKPIKIRHDETMILIERGDSVIAVTVMDLDYLTLALERIRNVEYRKR